MSGFLMIQLIERSMNRTIFMIQQSYKKFNQPLSTLIILYVIKNNFAEMADYYQKKPIAALLFLIAFIHAGLHIAVGIYGRRWSDDYLQTLPPGARDITYNQIRRESIFLFVSAGLIVLFSLVGIMVFCCRFGCLSRKAKYYLAIFVLILELLIAVVLVLRHQWNVDYDDILPDFHLNPTIRTSNDSFNTYYKLVLADWISSFALSALLLLAIICDTFNEVTNIENIEPVILDVPPMSDRYM